MQKRSECKSQPYFAGVAAQFVLDDSNVIFGYASRSTRNVKIAFFHGSLMHYAGILFFNEFRRVPQLRRLVTLTIPDTTLPCN